MKISRPRLFVADAQDEGSTLGKFLAERLKEYSGKQIKSMIDAGTVCVNKKILQRSSYRICAGDSIEAYVNIFAKRKKISSEIGIIYETSHYFLCFKPIEMPSEEDSFCRALGKTVFPVHRLDKETSGIILVAKTAEAQKKLQKIFRERKISKKYIAIVEGRLKKKKGELEGFFAKKRQIQGQSLWTGKARQGLYALTMYEVLQEYVRYSLLALMPYTGRTHQLRVQCSELGHPIVGDCQYGSKTVAERMFLHAYELAFEDPFAKKMVSKKAPIPQEFKAFLQKAGQKL
ncbi:MAG: RluA family pseudouridine synthase [Simkaniaceae bacterium]